MPSRTNPNFANAIRFAQDTQKRRSRGRSGKDDGKSNRREPSKSDRQPNRVRTGPRPYNMPRPGVPEPPIGPFDSGRMQVPIPPPFQQDLGGMQQDLGGGLQLAYYGGRAFDDPGNIPELPTRMPVPPPQGAPPPPSGPTQVVSHNPPPPDGRMTMQMPPFNIPAPPIGPFEASPPVPVRMPTPPSAMPGGGPLPWGGAMAGGAAPGFDPGPPVNFDQSRLGGTLFAGAQATPGAIGPRAPGSPMAAPPPTTGTFTPNTVNPQKRVKKPGY